MDLNDQDFVGTASTTLQTKAVLATLAKVYTLCAEHTVLSLNNLICYLIYYSLMIRNLTFVSKDNAGERYSLNLMA